MLGLNSSASGVSNRLQWGLVTLGTAAMVACHASAPPNAPTVSTSAGTPAPTAQAGPAASDGPAATATSGAPTANDAPAVPTTAADVLATPEAARPQAPAFPAPAACAAGAQPCTPGSAFSEALCAASNPDRALPLFAQGSAYTRAYVAADVEAWNASGARAEKARLSQGEEVVVLAVHAPAPTGIVMVGAASTYDVVRWDGACVSLSGEEMRFTAPPAVKHAPVPLRRLTSETRDALLGGPAVAKSARAAEHACGAPMTAAPKDASAACARAAAALDEALARAVKDGAVSRR
jgi:hypothetical protein